VEHRTILRHPLFVDSHDLVVDEKNRILIPAEYRKRMDPERDGEILYLTTGTVNGKPWLYTEKYYQFRAEQEPLDLMAGEERNTYDQMAYSLASPIEIDKQGRILIAERTMKRLCLGKELTMCGVRDHLELWNRQEWEARRAELEKRRSEIMAKESMSRRLNPPAQGNVT
jgi:MraZ protein